MGYGETALLDDEMKDTNGNYTMTDKNEEAWTKMNLGLAVSPVIGLTVKYSYFALRITYQYRWSIQKDLKDFIGDSRISIGAGVSF